MSPKVRYWLKEIAIMVAVGAAALLIFQFVQHERQRGGGGNLEVGQVAPEFALDALSDQHQVSLGEHVGKPMILAFWATWCGPCRAELPVLDTLHREAEDNYAVVTISGESPGTVKRFLRTKRYAFPVLMDRYGAAHRAYKVDSFPTTVLIDRHGKIVHDFSGTADLDIMRDHLAELTTD